MAEMGVSAGKVTAPDTGLTGILVEYQKLYAMDKRFRSLSQLDVLCRLLMEESDEQRKQVREFIESYLDPNVPGISLLDLATDGFCAMFLMGMVFGRAKNHPPLPYTRLKELLGAWNDLEAVDPTFKEKGPLDLLVHYLREDTEYGREQVLRFIHSYLDPINPDVFEEAVKGMCTMFILGWTWSRGIRKAREVVRR